MKYRIVYAIGVSERLSYGRDPAIEMCKRLRALNVACWIAPDEVTTTRLRFIRECLRPMR